MYDTSITNRPRRQRNGLSQKATMATKPKTKTKSTTKTTIAAAAAAAAAARSTTTPFSALSALYSAQLPPVSQSFSPPKTQHTRLDQRNERCTFKVGDRHPSSCRFSPRRPRCHDFSTTVFQSPSSGTKATSNIHADGDDFRATSSKNVEKKGNGEDSSIESPSQNFVSRQQQVESAPAPRTEQLELEEEEEEEEDYLDSIISERFSLLNDDDFEEELVEELANVTFITRNGTKITTPRKKSTKPISKSKTKSNATQSSLSSSSSSLSSSSSSLLSSTTTTKLNQTKQTKQTKTATTKSTIDANANAIDSFWSWALQSSSPKSTSPQTKQTNRRMQMFAYLSQPIVEVQIVGLVLLSCLLVAVDTLEGLPPALRYGINAVDTLCVYLFAVEFFLRWWSAGRFQWRYLAKPLVSIDAVVVILPLLLSGLLPLWDLGVMTGVFPGVSLPGWLLTASSSANSALLNLRLLRILKFQRVLTDETTYAKFEMALLGIKKNDVRPYQLQLARVLISIFTLVSVSTGLIYSAEHDVNPAIPDYFTALYFGLTTLTTVGFGDITPVTGAGRLVVGGSILAGVAVIPAQAASLAEAYLDFQKERSLTALGRKTKTMTTMKTTKTTMNGNNNNEEGKRRMRVPGEGVDSGNASAISTTTVCGKCGAGFHRVEASFCWSCGAALRTMDGSS